MQDLTAFDVSSLSPSLARELVGRLFAAGALREDVEEELGRLEREYDVPVYSELLYLLSHLRFEPDEAKAHWTEILALRDVMERRLGPPVELRLALLRYFTLVHPKLVNPKIIELSLFEFTRASAYTDELTGARNYRFFVESLRAEVLRSDQYGAPLSVVMADVDSFKQYNDQNGHETGNTALTAVANLLRQSVRAVDVVARYGGEEFAIILPCTTKEGAGPVAERMRTAVEEHEFPHGSGQPGGRLTVSFGFATYPADARDAGELVRNADRALYQAKAEGRNRVRKYADSLRSYPRRAADLEATGRVCGRENVPLRVVQVGEGGMLLLSEQEIEADTLIETRFRLPGAEEPIRAAGRVLRVRRRESGEFEAAVRFVEVGTIDRRTLGRFVKQVATGAGED